MKRTTSSLLTCLLLGSTACDPSGSPESSSPASSKVAGPAAAQNSGTVAASTGLADAAVEIAKDAGLTEILDSREPYQRASRLGALLPSLSPDYVPQIKEVLGNYPIHLGSAEFELLLRFWANQEPAEAADWAFEFGPPVYKTQAVRLTIEVLARNDPAKAVPAAQRAFLSSAEVSGVAQIALIAGWFAHDRAEVLEYVEGLGQGITRQRALYAYFLSLGGNDGAEAVIAFAEAYPEDNAALKREVFEQASTAMIWSAPKVVSDFCDRHCSGPFGAGLRTMLIRSYLNRGDSGREVLEWVNESTPLDDPGRDHAMWVAYSAWCHKNDVECKEWMSQQVEAGPEPWTKPLLGEYSRQLAADDPSAALQAATMIEDETDRRRSVIRIARLWLKRDRPAALAWIEASSLDERARKFILESTLPLYLPGVDPEDPS